MDDITGKIEVPESLTGSETPAPLSMRSRFSKLVSKVNRRSLLIVASVVLIGGAVYLNWLFFSGDSAKEADNGYVIDYTGSGDAATYVSADGTEGADNYFASVELSRQQARDEAVEVLSLVVDSEEALEELRVEAAADITRIAGFIECEANIETLIMAKGFEECVAVVNENSANVVVKTDGLLPNQVIQIKEIVCEQSGLEPSSVKIVEMN